MHLCGILGLLTGAVGAANELRQLGLVLAGVGVASGIHSFFTAFLIDVFTEMRWYLAKIAGRR